MSSATLGSAVMAWATLLGLVLGPGLVATVVWSPVLMSSRLRSLFRSLPLTDSMAVNYVFTAIGLSVPWIVGFGWALAALDAQTTKHPTGDPLLTAAGWLSTAYIIGIPLVAAIGLPWIGVDWDDYKYGKGTWLRLIGGALWYVTIFAVPTIVFGILISIPV